MYILYLKAVTDRIRDPSARESAAVYASFVGFQFILFAVLRAFGV
jgi:hypothetical protein